LDEDAAFPATGDVRSEWTTEELIRVDEYRENGSLVVRAELPGIDPDTDVEINVSDGMLRIEAERRAEEKTDENGYVREELSLGSFTRTLPLPEGVTESDITASYKDGILEIRIPAPEPERPRKSRSPSPEWRSQGRASINTFREEG
jgi:HSP20 family protein